MSAVAARVVETLPVADRFRNLRERWWPEMSALADREIRGTWSGGVPSAERRPVLGAGGPTGPVQAISLEALASGGKRLRAVVPLLVAEALDVDPMRLLPLGAACEVLHNATLVHDDLQDGDAQRRGQPTVWKRHGAAQAINVGDAMLFVPSLLLARLDVDGPVREALTRRLVHDTLAVIDGQALEIVLRDEASPSVDTYLAMVEGKTSGLFALPMAGAALACGADELTVVSLTEAARHLGVLFQIQDDLLDLYGDKGREAVGNDLREGKRSFLVVHALTHAPPASRVWLRSLLDGPRDAVNDAAVGHAIALFERVGSVGCALDELSRRRERASAVVTDPRLRELCRGLADLLVEPVAGLAGRTLPRTGTTLGRTS